MQIIQTTHVPIKAWVDGVAFEDAARRQVENVASMPFIHSHVALTFTLEDHERAVEGVECRRDADVIDETPGAYKPIDAVMAAQRDLVEVVHELKQVLCVKG